MSMTGSVRNAVRANIVAWDGGGLGTDIDILTKALVRAGCSVTFKGRRHRKPRSRAHSLLSTAGVVMAQQWATLTRRPQFDVNFFIESVFPEYLPTGRVNCLFPHPEFFRDSNLPHLPRLDFVLCKTPSAVEAFRGLPVRCREIAWTSPDQRIPAAAARTSPSNSGAAICDPIASRARSACSAIRPPRKRSGDR